MAEHSLRSLARHQQALSRIEAELGPARATLLRDTLRHALCGEPYSRERLRVVLQPLDRADEDLGSEASESSLASEEALASLEGLLEGYRATLPALLWAAGRGDARLLELSREELLSLLPLWIESARAADARDQEAFASLFTQLAGAEALQGVATLAAPLRRIFLGASEAAAKAALGGLFLTSGIRPEDRRFFRRLDMHLATGLLSHETMAQLGAWLTSQEELRGELIERGGRGPLRVRLRAVRHLVAAAMGADALTAPRLEEVARHLRRLLGDPSERIGHLAAKGAAWLAPHPLFDDLWEPWFASEPSPPWGPRAAAGLGPLFSKAPERASELLSALLAGGRGVGQGAERSAWLCALARSLAGLARSAPDRLEAVLEHLAASGEVVSLAAASEELAALRIRDDALPLEEAWIRRLDQAMGGPEGRTAEEWAIVLGAREALVVARGGRPATSLRMLARLLALDSLRGEPPARVISAAEELMVLAARRIGALSTPGPTEEAVTLGGAIHDLDDVVTSLVEDDLLGAILLAQPASRPEALEPLRERLRALQRELRFELHRIAGARETPPWWRAITIARAAHLACSVPDDPLGRPSAPRTAGFVQLAGLPEFLHAWRRGEQREAARGLGRVVEAVLPGSLPGSGDLLLALVLCAPGKKALLALAEHVAEGGAREGLEALASLASPGPDGAAKPGERLAWVLQALDELMSFPAARGVFAASRDRELVEQVCRHLRAARAHARLISFMTPVRVSLEQSAEPLLVCLARDLAELCRVAGEGGEAARRVALRALGEGDTLLSLAGAQALSRAALESASVEAEWVVASEEVAEAVRRGASAATGDRETVGASLGDAAQGLRALAAQVADALPGLVGALFGELLELWARLVDERRARALEAPAHPELIDRFQVERLLGEGGMAFTYLAKDPALERMVTLKVMKPEIAHRPELRRLVSTEGMALAALPAHPHVVQVFEHLDAEDAPCLVMEYVDGQPLADLIPSRGMPLKRGLDLAVAAAQGLHHVHRHQLVHLDVKAENVMVARDGSPKIIDFGLAQKEHSHRQTKTVFGTPVYMSPEQARGLTLGAASDVYSFGVLLYEIFSGDVPFDSANPMEILRAHVSQAPPALSSRRADLPDGLVLLVGDMLQKRPEDRPWMVEVASRLARLRSALEPKEGGASELGRRELAVLCASLEGLEADTRDPAAVAAALECFLGASLEIVTGLGGRVDATVGERVFAVFGYPREDGQAALHAIKAGIQLRLRFERLGLPGISVRAGVAAGQGLAGQVRGDPTDATVLGAPLWRAARLVEVASEDEPLVVDEAALELGRGLVEGQRKQSSKDLGRYYAVTPKG